MRKKGKNEMQHPIHSIVEWWAWLVFTFPLIVILFIDLTIGNKPHGETSIRSSATSLGIWFLFSLLFCAFLWWHLQHTKSTGIANEYTLIFFTGYIVEKLVSIENMIVLFTLFEYFELPKNCQRYALFIGITGAILFRFIAIIGSIWLLEHYAILIYFFGAFLIYSGIKMLVFLKEEKVHLETNPVLKFLKKHCKLTNQYSGKKWFVKKNKVLYLTPLCLVVIFIQLYDLLFAVESLPAIFGITKDPFVIYSSNILALIGLRSMYLFIKQFYKHFLLLKHAISIIFIFIGIKMLLAYWFSISIYYTASIIFSIIGCSLILSLIITQTKKHG